MSAGRVAARPFAQVDVFTATPLLGNPVAVVLDAVGMTDEEMARFARWTNLSETTFVLPPRDPAADYRLRIFTPGGELPFAGHPTLGSAHAWLQAGGSPARPGTVVQECGVGLVRLSRGDRLAFAAPPLRRSGPVDDALRARVARALRLAPEDLLACAWVDNGPPWIGAVLRDGAAVLAVEPDLAAMGDLAVGVLGRWGPGHDTDVEVRAFVPGMGVPEDPVTGSLNAGFATWLIGDGTLPPTYVAAQGTVLGRAGRVHVHREGEDVWVGGDTTTCVRGDVRVA